MCPRWHSRHLFVSRPSLSTTKRIAMLLSSTSWIPESWWGHVFPLQSSALRYSEQLLKVVRWDPQARATHTDTCRQIIYRSVQTWGRRSWWWCTCPIDRITRPRCLSDKEDTLVPPAWSSAAPGADSAPSSWQTEQQTLGGLTLLCLRFRGLAAPMSPNQFFFSCYNDFAHTLAKKVFEMLKWGSFVTRLPWCVSKRQEKLWEDLKKTWTTSGPRGTLSANNEKNDEITRPVKLHEAW